MRICGIQVELRSASAVEPAFRWRNGLPGSDGPVMHAILRVQTDEGIDGVVPVLRGPYGSLVLSNPVVREVCVDAHGLVHAPQTVGLGVERLWQHQGHNALAEQI